MAVVTVAAATALRRRILIALEAVDITEAATTEAAVEGSTVAEASMVVVRGVRLHMVVEAATTGSFSLPGIGRAGQVADVRT